MASPLTLIAVLAALAALYVVFPVVASAYARYSGTKRPVCPETGEEVRLELDANRAAKSAAAGRIDLRVTRCSLWPVHGGCHQGCTAALR